VTAADMLGAAQKVLALGRAASLAVIAPTRRGARRLIINGLEMILARRRTSNGE
jgi:hypothetical protein